VHYTVQAVPEFLAIFEKIPKKFKHEILQVSSAFLSMFKRLVELNCFQQQDLYLRRDNVTVSALNLHSVDDMPLASTGPKATPRPT